jgi:23S rRNA pseudouridine2605 synthase
VSRYSKGTVSLERALSKLGIASRTEARRLILGRHVMVDGRPVRDPLFAVNPERARIEVDGQRVAKAKPLVLALHKPVGVVTTRSDELGRRTVYDLLPAELPFVGPVGRLDFESSGLLLLTNDSRLADRIASPGGCEKVYEVAIDQPFSAAAVAAFRAGLQLEDGPPLAPVEVSVDPGDPTHARFTLHEGRNRQIRRMCGAFGWAVLALHRVRIGPITLGALASGASRPLTAAEDAALRAAVAPRA